jgi:hypothetical protein
LLEVHVLFLGEQNFTEYGTFVYFLGQGKVLINVDKSTQAYSFSYISIEQVKIFSLKLESQKRQEDCFN